ncbi:MAG: hypothetical protein AAF149_10240 [Bacteroidota bacterium]
MARLSILILMLAFSCKSLNNGRKYEGLAYERYGEGTVFHKNGDNSLILCINETKGSTKNPQNAIDFFVFCTAKDSIIYSDYISPGSVSWFSDNQIELFYLPGVMPQGKTRDDFVYIYDLETGIKTRKSDFDKKGE